MDGQITGDQKTVQSRLRFLFDTVRPDGRPRYTFREVADAINTAVGEPTITASYIHHLCTGRRTNPGTRQITALARFFRVPPGFLLGEDAADTAAIVNELRQLRQQRDLQEALDDPAVQILAMRARGLAPQHLQLVLDLVESVRKLEAPGVDPSPPAESSAPPRTVGRSNDLRPLEVPG